MNDNHISIELFDVGEQSFESNSVKTAGIRLSNHLPVNAYYDVELYLSQDNHGKTKASTSGIGSITIPANSTVLAEFTLIMPQVEIENKDKYGVFLSISSGDGQLILYKSVSDLKIMPSSNFGVDFVGWQ